MKKQKPYLGVDNLEVLAEARKYNQFLIDQILYHRNSGNLILDFGSGIGTFCKALKEKGIPVLCVESDLNLLERLRKSGFKGYLNLDDIGLETLDFIYSLNVLEHIEDDFTVIKELYRRLRPGGRIFIYVPAFQFLYSSMDRKVGHFRRYRKKDLVHLLEKSGFSVENAVYVDSLGFLASVLFKFIGNKEGNLNRQIIKIYDTWFFPLSRILDRVLGGILGKNLMVSAIR